MKYYLFEVSTGDERITGKSVYEYDSEQLAVANFHSKMGTAMKSELYDTELGMVIDEYGTVLKRERYVKPVPVVEEPQEEPTEETAE